jgi:ligand-binding sensor domain-containing protein
VKFIAGLSFALMTAQQALALDPAKHLNQFGHTTWTVENGAPTNIMALAQTADGYLWIGAMKGLYRFDGVKFEQIPSSLEHSPQSDGVTALLTARNGDLWFGHLWGGLSVLHDGQLRNVNPARPNGIVFRIVQSKDGAVWAATNGIRLAGLRRFLNGKWTIINAGERGLPKVELSDVLAARDGTLWAALIDRIVRLKPGAQNFEAVGDKVRLASALSEDADGRVWVLDADGARPLAGRSTDSSPSAQIGVRPEINTAFIRDHQSQLWAASETVGLLRIRDPRAFDRGSLGGSAIPLPSKEDLETGFPDALLEDREGNLWVGTNRGLDRFRVANVVTQVQSSSTASLGSPYILLLPTNAGDFYAMWNFGSSRESGKATHLYLNQKGRWIDLSHFAEHPTGACVAGDSGLWMADGNGVHHLQGNRIDRTISLPPSARHHLIKSCLQDGRGRLWISAYGDGLFKFEDSRWTRVDVAPELASVWPYAWEVDPRGRVLAYFGTRSLYRIDGDRIETLLTPSEINLRLIETIFSVGNRILLGGERGIMISDNGGAFKTLSATRFPYLAHVAGLIQTSSGDIWALSAVGLVRLKVRDVNLALSDDSVNLPSRIFDFHDDLGGDAQSDSKTNMLEGADGKIWLATTDALSWIDPRHLHHNDRPPTVLLRSIIADGRERKPGSSLTLPAGTSQLQIDYTATSLTAPEKIDFRYRLDGVDKDWVKAGTRRQAFYTNLGPGKYRFRVTAANEDGMWNKIGAAIDLEILPTFTQSRGFLFLCAVAICGALWLLYQIRLNQVSDRLRVGHEERTAERERIARELHDTLLQGVQGLIFRFQSVAASIPEEQAARKSMEQALDRADDVVAEARDRVAHLRRTKIEGTLSQVLQDAADRLLSGHGIHIHLITEGRARDLSDLVGEELVRIAEEFLTNTRNHSEAKHINIALNYGRTTFSLQMRDDGQGIDSDTLQRGERDGHFGLPGMRERARRIGAEFELASPLGGGVIASIRVPAGLAYGRNSNRSPTLHRNVHDSANG